MRRPPARWMLAGLSVGVVAGALGAGGLASAGAHSAVGRACPHPTVPVPPNEPVYTAGPTEAVSGLYIQGGPVPPPPCQPKPRGPYAGTIRVIDARTGATVARQTVANGHLAHIRLSPGRYRLSGRMSGGGRTTTTPTITIRHCHRTRQDLFEDVP